MFWVASAWPTSVAESPCSSSLAVVQVDLDVRRHPAVRRRDGHPRNRYQGWSDHVRGDVVDLGRRHRRRCDLQIENGDAGCVEHQYAWRRDPCRHLLEHGLRCGRHLRLRSRHVGARLEVDLDDPAAIIRLAFYMLDAADRCGQGTFVIVNNASRHVGRREAVVRPYDCDDGNLDWWKDVRRRG